jgi:hypothetical protein
MAGSHKITVYHTTDKHRLLSDLYKITRTQITKLLEKVEEGLELSSTDLKTLDLSYDGLKKLINIEKELKSDKIGSMTDDQLEALVMKARRDRKKP